MKCRGYLPLAVNLFVWSCGANHRPAYQCKRLSLQVGRTGRRLWVTDCNASSLVLRPPLIMFLTFVIWTYSVFINCNAQGLDIIMKKIHVTEMIFLRFFQLLDLNMEPEVEPEGRLYNVGSFTYLLILQTKSYTLFQQSAPPILKTERSPYCGFRFTLPWGQGHKSVDTLSKTLSDRAGQSYCGNRAGVASTRVSNSSFTTEGSFILRFTKTKWPLFSSM